MAGKLSKRKLTAAQKQAEAMRLRIAGRSFDAIAEELGYASKSGAYKAVIAGLRDTLQEPADELRTMEVERLDAMLHALWPLIERPDGGEPDLGAVDRALRLMERRSKLLGLDSPVRADVAVTANIGTADDWRKALGLYVAEDDTGATDGPDRT